MFSVKNILQRCVSLVVFLISSQIYGQQSPTIQVEGSGPPLLLFQGGSNTVSVFDPHVRDLKGRFKVVRMERLQIQAIQNNQPLPENYSVRMESERAFRLLDSLMMKEPVILAGHSYGALIALDFALNHPERVAALILAEPPAFWLPLQKSEHPIGMDEMIRVVSQFGPNVVISEDHLAQFRCLLMNCKSIDSLKKDPQFQTWTKNRHSLRGLAAVSNHTDSIQRLMALNLPVLLITGNETVPFHKRINELLKSAIPGAKEVHIPGGHGAVIVEPLVFIRVLISYLQAIGQLKS